MTNHTQTRTQHTQRQTHMAEKTTITKPYEETYNGQQNSTRHTIEGHTIEGHTIEGHTIEDRYNFHDASFRRHYQLNYSDDSKDYDTYYAPAYRFGYELAEEHEGADWESVKREAEDHWQMKHNSGWQSVASAVHYGWREQRDPNALRVHHHGEYSDYRKGFLTHYADAIHDGGVGFEDYEPAYRRGYDLAIDPTYRTHLWTEMEPELRQYYEEEYADGSLPWEHYRNAVQYAWHDVRAMGI